MSLFAEYDDMRVLTVRQPWAWAIAAGLKRVENRTWYTNYRGPLAIHAAERRYDPAGDQTFRSFGLDIPVEPERGVIVAVVELVDCIRDSQDDWAQQGCWHWLLRDAQTLAEPYPWHGQLGLMTPHPNTQAAILRRCWG